MKKENQVQPMLVLASASPRRMDLLQRAGILHQVYPVDIDESPHPHELPESLVARLAHQKAAAAAALCGDKIPILGADTMVVCNGTLLGKPPHEGAARQMLQQLSGKTHQVLTGYHVRYVDTTGQLRSIDRVVPTEVEIKPLTDPEIQAYLACEEWRGKAGGYAIQGRFSCFVRAIRGNYDNIVGLPVCLLREDLLTHGLLPAGPVWG